MKVSIFALEIEQLHKNLTEVNLQFEFVRRLSGLLGQ